MTHPFPDSIKISGVIITYNEERHIKQCITSMLEIVDEIVVVDSFSTDQTVEICKGLGAKVIQHPFEGHIQQKNFAMHQASFDHVLSLDADERVSSEMVASIKAVRENWQADGYVFSRFNNYCGTWLKHSWYPDKKLRLWDRRIGKWGGTNPHDKVVMNNGVEVRKLKGDILHYAYENLEEHYEQIKKFAVIAANAKFEQGKRVNFGIHVLLNPWYKFFRKYVLRLGFLDGYYGFIFSGLTAYLNFMKYLRLWELNRNKNKK
ncbi:MAG: glycosyltransferase family 2 protein [Fulvivirga sp.]